MIVKMGMLLLIGAIDERLITRVLIMAEWTDGN